MIGFGFGFGFGFGVGFGFGFDFGFGFGFCFGFGFGFGLIFFSLGEGARRMKESCNELNRLPHVAIRNLMTEST